MTASSSPAVTQVQYQMTAPHTTFVAQLIVEKIQRAIRLVGGTVVNTIESDGGTVTIVAEYPVGVDQFPVSEVVDLWRSFALIKIVR